MAQLLLEDKIAKMVSVLSIPNEFGPDEDDSDAIHIDYKVSDAIYRNGGVICSGCSKMVIVMNNCDKVIKVPYEGSYYYDNYYNEETEEWEGDEDGCFSEFTGARNYHNNWDYCKTEEEVYYEAEDYGVAEFFAKTEYYTSIDNHPIYIAEKVKEYYEVDENSRSFSDKADSIYKSNRNMHSYFEPAWVKCAIDWYGEDKVNMLLDFIKEFRLSDFHNHNIGFRVDGSPVILDYSDFNE